MGQGKEFLVVLTLISFAHYLHCATGLEFHEHLTPREYNSIFDFDHDPKNLRYDVARLYHKDLPTQGSQVLKTLKTTKFLDLHLETHDNYLVGRDTPFYFSNYDEKHKKIVHTRAKEFPVPEDFALYQDRRKGAALSAHTDRRGKTRYLGILNENTFIRPIPARLHDLYKNESDLVETRLYLDDDWIESEPHLIIDRTEWIPENSTDDASIFEENTDQERLSVSLRKIENASNQSSIITNTNKNNQTRYVEILLHIDYDIYQQYSKNAQAIAMYQASFWNTVDLMYRQFKFPQVRMNIAGIVIAQSPKAENFMYTHYVDGKLNSGPIFGDAVKHFRQQQHIFPFDSYDIVAVFANRPMVTVWKEQRIDINGIAAAIGSVCQHKPGTSITIFRDRGNFDVYGAAHEIGHLLGSPHDHSRSSEDCPEHSGYLMGNPGPGIKSVMWSQCSVRNIKKTLTTDSTKCLLNKPKILRPLNRQKILQGKLYDRNYQCKVLLKDSQNVLAYRYSQNSCKQLECEYDVTGVDYYGRYYTSRSVHVSSNPAPLEGTPCGVTMKGICINGFCTSEKR